MHGPLRVAVVSRHALIRAGLTHLAGQDPHRATVVTSGDEELGGVDHDVTLVDLAGRTHPSDLCHLVTAGHRPVVALTTGVDPELASRLRTLGVHHVVPMEITAEALLTCLEEAAQTVCMSTEQVRTRSRHLAHRRAGLTERELDILERIAAGQSNTQIAAELFISINTVKSSIRTAYKRIGARTRSQAVIWAVQHDLAS